MDLKRVEANGEIFHGTMNGSMSDSQSFQGQYYQDDILVGLPLLLEGYKGSIQLVYMDPPYVTGQLFSFKQKLGETGWKGDSRFILTHTAYNDKWEKGKGYFLSMMRQVLKMVYDLLSPEGCIYLHVDYRTSAYLRVIMDEIFGEENFLNEIIWHYKSGGRARKHFSRKHDTILFYRKSKDYYFNIEAEGKPRGTQKRNHMKKQLDEDGRVFWSIKSGGKVYRYYEDTMVYPSDVWDDISHLHQKDPERTGYDTQKPEALLRRIIAISSRPGDLVADFFAGSGTTLKVAQDMGRRWIGIDKASFALHVCRKRLIPVVGGGKVVFLHNKGPAKPQGKVDIKIEADGGSGHYTEIKLAAYKPVSCNAVLKPGMTVRDLDWVDYWAVGYIENGLFHAKELSYRSSKHPGLDSILRLDKCDGLRPAIHVVDVLGNQNFYELR